MKVRRNCHMLKLGIMDPKSVGFSVAFLGLAFMPDLSAEPIAQVTSVQGKVLLNQGDGFQTVEKMTTVDVGDQLLVSKDASVSLNYASADCATTFVDPSLVTVSSAVPCANQTGIKKSGSTGGGGTAVSGAAQSGSTAFSIPSLGGGSTGTTSTPPPAASLP